MPEQFTQTEFITSIREKYPQYEDIDDSTLVSSIVEKFPVYKDQISDFGKPIEEKVIEEGPKEKQKTVRPSPLGATIESFKRLFKMKKSGELDIFTDALVKELEEKPLASEFLTGLLGEHAQIGQELPEAKTIGKKVARGAARLTGTVIGFAPIAKASKAIGIGSRIARKHGLIGRLVGSAETFVAHGQLTSKSTDYVERLKSAGGDLATGLVFGLAGGLGKDYLKGFKGKVASYPAMFGIGFGMSKMGDSSNEDAIINGALLVALHGIFDIGGKKPERVKASREFLIKKLESEGIKNPESIVNETFKQAVEFKKTHPKEYEELFIKPIEGREKIQESAEFQESKFVQKINEGLEKAGLGVDTPKVKETPTEVKLVQSDAKPTVTQEFKTRKARYQVFSDGKIEKTTKTGKVEISTQEFERVVKAKQAGQKAFQTRQEAETFIPEKLLDELPALRALRGTAVGTPVKGEFGAYQTELEGVKIGKSPIGAKDIFDRKAPENYDTIPLSRIEEIDPVLASKVRTETGEVDFDKLLNEAQREVQSVTEGKFEGTPEMREVQARLREEEEFNDRLFNENKELQEEIKLLKEKDVEEELFKDIDNLAKEEQVEQSKRDIKEPVEADATGEKVRLSGVFEKESTREFEAKQGLSPTKEASVDPKTIQEGKSKPVNDGIKEVGNKFKHENYKENPYEAGTFEWNQWNEAWDNYQPLPQKTPELHGGLPIHKLIPRKLRTKIETFFAPFSRTPESKELLEKRGRMFGFVDRSEGFIGKINKKLDKFDADTKKDIFRYLDGQLDLSDLPKGAQRPAKSIQQRTITIGKMLVKRGILSQETVDKLEGKYIHYMYAKHILGEKAIVGIRPSGRLDLSYTKERNPDMTPEQREALGLIEDASIAVPAGMGKALVDIGKFDYMKAIAENPKWVWEPSLVRVGGVEQLGTVGEPSTFKGGKKMGIGKLVEEVKTFSKMVKKFPENEAMKNRHAELKSALDKARVDTKNAPADFVQLPTTKGYGDLAGAYVRKSIADDLLPLTSSVVGGRGDLFGALAKIEQQGVALHKMGKVALNVPTVVRNIVSNIFQNNMRGRALGKIPGDIVKGAKSMLNKDKHFVEAKKLGLFRTNWSVTEIKDVINEFSGITLGKWGKFYTAVSNVAKYYGRIDDIAKHTIYVQLRGKGVPIGEAVVEAQKWGMDYSLGSRSIKELRRHIIPFGTYQYKIAPLIYESLMKRPWVIGKYLTIPFLAKEAAQSLNDISQEDWKKLKAQLPDYVKNNRSYMVIPHKNEQGQWQFINLEYYFPWGNWFAIFKDLSKGDWAELAKDSGVGNPFLDLFVALKTNKDTFTKRQIINPVDTPSKQWLSAFEYMFFKFAPSALSRYGALGYTVRIGNEDKWGRTITPLQAIGRWFGWNVITISKSQSKAIRKAKLTELSKEYNRIKSDPSIPMRYKKKVKNQYLAMRKELLGK